MKIGDHGYWVSKLFYVQSLYYYAVNVIRFRSLGFFAACNPAIKFGGMLDDRKSKIYELLPESSVPQTSIIRAGENPDAVLDYDTLKYPIVVKPDIGLKGMNVHILDNEAALTKYLAEMKHMDLLVQEYVDLPSEYSLMYYRYPLSGLSGITSIVKKVYPTLHGDGKSSIDQLLDQNNNPFLNKKISREHLGRRLLEILPHGTEVIAHRVGNYSQGARFQSLNERINDTLLATVDRLFKSIGGVYFARIDFKSQELEDFGSKNFKIIEINGAKSEPLHIYDSKITWIKKLKDVRIHWKHLANIVGENLPKKKNKPAFVDLRHGLQQIKKASK